MARIEVYAVPFVAAPDNFLPLKADARAIIGENEARAAIAFEEITTGVTWTEAPVAPSQTYLGSEVPFPLPAIAAIEVFVMAYVETKRAAEKDPLKRIYPGGSFDPAGFSKGNDFETLKKKEIANGRVAMLAFAGIIGEAQANNLEGPVHALARHIADPWHTTAASNALAVPYL